jgi:hypothetical protein
MRAMRCTSSRVAAIALLLFVACGGGDGDGGDGGDASGEDFVGSYQVTSHRESHQAGDPVSCSDPGPEIEPGDPGYAPYFALVIDEFFEDPDVLDFQTCDGPDSGCVDGGIGLERVGDRLESTSANTQEGNGSCALHASLSTLVLDGDVATLEDRRWSVFDHPVDDCTVEAAEALVESPDCRDVVVWVGTRQ